MYIFTAARTQYNDDRMLEGFIVFVKVATWLCLVLMPWAMLAMLGDITGVVELSSFAFNLVVFMLLGAVAQLFLYNRK